MVWKKFVKICLFDENIFLLYLAKKMITPATLLQIDHTSTATLTTSRQQLEQTA